MRPNVSPMLAGMATTDDDGGLSDCTIALVDDDRNILTSVSIALQSEGFRTRLYPDGESAFKALVANPADLGIFDIKMPRMDGIELLRKLREKVQMPVIFLTSKDDEIDEELGFATGADDYVSKPFSQRLLIARARAVLRRAENRRNAAERFSASGRNPIESRHRPRRRDRRGLRCVDAANGLED